MCAGHLGNANYAPRLLGYETFRLQRSKNFFQKNFFKEFFQKNFFLNIYFSLQTKAFNQKKKTCFKQKSFTLNIIEAFRRTLVKKNCQNRERRKRSGYRKKPSSDWLEKD